MGFVAPRMRLTFTPSTVPPFHPKLSFLRLATAQQRRYNGQHLGRRVDVRRNVSYAAVSEGDSYSGALPSTKASKMPKPTSPLSILPLAKLIRSFLITSISSSPLLLRTSLGALKFLAHSRSPILNPDRNPALHFLLKRTVYAQFCAGETAGEVNKTISGLKAIGYRGVMLGYAREVSVGGKDHKHLNDDIAQDQTNANQICSWAEGTLSTVKMAQAGDFVSIKLSGAGAQIAEHLARSWAPPPLMEKFMTEICELARARKVKLQIDAEQDDIQAGINEWAVTYMRRYNRSGKPLMYCTYQAYKKSVLAILASHLQMAYNDDFALGIKLVRGAYLWSDHRWLFWDTIERTHQAYDGIAESLIRQDYNEILKPPTATQREFPSVSLILAGHNAESVRKAKKLRNEQTAAGKSQIDLAYGQLMGMAENISCDLVHSGQLTQQKGEAGVIDVPRVYQYLTWGSVGECSQYLVRRAEENQDAASRNRDARNALGKELMRRLGLPLR